MSVSVSLAHWYRSVCLQSLQPLMLGSFQRLLDFDGCTNPQFSRADGLGRVGVAGFLTGIVFGVHLSIAGCCLAINGLVLSRLVRNGEGGGGGWVGGGSCCRWTSSQSR